MTADDKRAFVYKMPHDDGSAEEAFRVLREQLDLRADYIRERTDAANRAELYACQLRKAAQRLIDAIEAAGPNADGWLGNIRAAKDKLRNLL